MGFLGFLKKKPALQQPNNPGFDISKLDTDLPSIESASLPPLESLPSLDSTLPPLDGSNLSPFESPAGNNPSQNSISNSKISMADSKMPSLDFSMPENDDVEGEMNKLFLSDEWKEPDWSSYDPYSTPDIEPPDPKDFGLETYESQPPAASEQNVQQQPAQEQVVQHSDLPSFDEQTEQPILIEDRAPRKVPFELYVRGTHYNDVFFELSKINELLNQEDPKLDMLQNYTKTEDDALNKAKDNMEYMYRKMMYVDKIIFS